jgi:hypothetical protein
MDKDARLFLTAGFRGKLQRGNPTNSNNYSLRYSYTTEFGKGGPWLITKDKVTGEITKERLKIKDED